MMSGGAGRGERAIYGEEERLSHMMREREEGARNLSMIIRGACQE